MGFATLSIWLLALCLSAGESSARLEPESCTLNCRELTGNDTTSRRDRCALWYTLSHLQLDVEVWIQQLPCETYVQFANETFSEDFVIGGKMVEGLNFTGRVVGGGLAPQVADFWQLWDFSCSGCNLTGAVPATWTSWDHIRTLDLSRNSLSGPLPGPWHMERGAWDPALPITLNFSHNPHLRGPHLPLVADLTPPPPHPPHPRPSTLDLNGSGIHQPLDWGVLEWYCRTGRTRPGGVETTRARVLNGSTTLCATLNFRHQVGWAWLLFVVFTLSSLVALMLTGPDGGRDLALDPFTREQIEDMEVSYLPLPTSVLEPQGVSHFHRGLVGPRIPATGGGYGEEGEEEERVDDHDVLPIGPPRFSKVSMLLLVALALVQVGLDTPHLSEARAAGKGHWVWVLVLVVPHVACATVLHAAMLRHQAGWVKVVVAYVSIPLIMVNMPVTWVLGVLRELINAPRSVWFSALQVVLGIFLLPLVLVPVPTILLLLLLMIIGWPEMDYAAFGRNAGRVFRELRVNSYTYTLLLHWTVALLQAPLAALLVTFMHAFWFDEATYFSESRQQWLAAEFVMALFTMWAHLLVLARMPSSPSGDLFTRIHRRLLAAQLDLDPVLPPSHPMIIHTRSYTEPSYNPLLTGEEPPSSAGVLRRPDGGEGSRPHGIALSDAEKEIILRLRAQAAAEAQAGGSSAAQPPAQPPPQDAGGKGKGRVRMGPGAPEPLAAPLLEEAPLAGGSSAAGSHSSGAGSRASLAATADAAEGSGSEARVALEEVGVNGTGKPATSAASEQRVVGERVGV